MTEDQWIAERATVEGKRAAPVLPKVIEHSSSPSNISDLDD